MYIAEISRKFQDILIIFTELDGKLENTGTEKIHTGIPVLEIAVYSEGKYRSTQAKGWSSGRVIARKVLRLRAVAARCASLNRALLRAAPPPLHFHWNEVDVLVISQIHKGFQLENEVFLCEYLVGCQMTGTPF